MSNMSKGAAASQQKNGQKDEQREKRYPTGRLLKSRHLAGYQPDFAKAILTKPAYSLSEAIATLDKALKGEA